MRGILLASLGRGIPVTLAMAGLLAVTACGSGGEAAVSAEGGLPAEIKIMTIKDRTGPVAFTGLSTIKGIELAVEQINAEKFLGETKIVLESKDPAGKAQTAASQMTAAIQDKSYAAVFGPVASDQAAATSPLAERGKMPIIYSQAGSEGVVIGKYTFRATPPMTSYYRVIGDHIKSKNVKTLGVVYNTTLPTLKEVAEKVLPEMGAELGFSVVSSAAVQMTTQDFAAPISKVVKEKPDAIALLLVGGQNPTAMRQLRQAGFDGLVLGNTAAGAGNLKPAGQDGAGMTWPSDFHPDQPGESTKKFVDLYQAKFNERPLNYAAEGYDSAWWLARAVKQAGGASRDDIQRGLDVVAAEGFEGAMGKLAFENRDMRLTGVIVQWNGTEEVLVGSDS
ncbi:ABC transporter substrate-binding protein [Nonomuraea cavernae]|uniref:Amino acid ABC transporter substrate-binding protein n=1 Tax=Nonomuraea cavernae TaxID=2045107 RepID=A0A917ZDU1_9ACTN|nr:ABC transporter substrate-binding protein [Nonomuraea cavernae]MCA2189740.1 ABC transporter substrate-binding protein [Nonomuraea cavernae]GGO80004.1 amino acid ABC transporter substrate-binding protein [Nonomuraea cavernae]